LEVSDSRKTSPAQRRQATLWLIFEVTVDSLKAIQVRNWVLKELGCEISVFDILSPIPLSQLASIVTKKSTLVDGDIRAALE